MLSSFVPPLTLPRARVEPIRTATEALSVVSLAISRPLRDELVVITCDRSNAGQSIAVFDVRADTPADLHALAHDVVGLASSSPITTGVIVAHVQPTDSPRTHDHLERTLSSCLDRAGLRLLHSFTVRHGAVHVTRQ